MAHPYAPMGGCYDDRVVGIVVDEFLKAGWIVGTFNFRSVCWVDSAIESYADNIYRGAHGSKGHTSWSGRPELDDYISFAAFFMHYISYLRPFPASNTVFEPDQTPTSPQACEQTEITNNQEGSPVVVLGGYSYGSLILKHLPPVPSILQPFSAPLSGSAADEILLRAHKLADQSNLEWINLAKDHDRRKRRGTENKLSVTMGGEETSPEKRRSSREIRRSMDGRRSLDIGNKFRSLSNRHQQDESPQTPPENTSIRPAITVPEVRYLMISPLMPPISGLAAPALVHKFWRSQDIATQDVFAKHDCLAIFGDQDIFSSVKKARDWSERLQKKSGTQFGSVEVKGAGHFWHEQGVERELRAALMKWEECVRVSTKRLISSPIT